VAPKICGKYAGIIRRTFIGKTQPQNTEPNSTAAQIYGRYPFDVKDKQYPQKFQHAIYLLPPEIPASDACKDLLARLLVADPVKRISLQNILSHPWFLETLPPGALNMNDHYLQKTTNLTEEVRPSTQSQSHSKSGMIQTTTTTYCKFGSNDDRDAASF
jgi:serine/threonine protein kinase